MKKLGEVSRLPDPSSRLPEDSRRESYMLPNDQEAENSIRIAGITTDDLIDACFQGIDLVTYDGEYLSRSLLASSINSAIAVAEQTFDIALTKKEVKGELHDYDGYGFNDYEYTALFTRPVRQIERMVLLYGNKEYFEIPKEWIKLDSKQGEITIFPTTGNLMLINPAQSAALPFYIKKKYMPMAISVDYTAGLEKDEIPANLMEFIMKRAAIPVLQVWGDQIIGAGIASSSVSIDGLSQSIGTTQSAMYGGASARIQDYKNDIKELTPIIRRYFSKFSMAVL